MAYAMHIRLRLSVSKGENVVFSKYSLPSPWHQKTLHNFMVFAPKELPPSDCYISSIDGIFQEQSVCPYKVWFADAKAPFL